MLDLINTYGVGYYLKRMPKELCQKLTHGEQLHKAATSGRSGMGIHTIGDIYVRNELTDCMSCIVENLSEIEYVTLELIVKQCGLDLFNMQRLQNISCPLAGAQIRVGLAGLCAKGIVIVLQKNWGEHVYVVPDDWLRFIRSRRYADISRMTTFREFQDSVLYTRYAGRGLAYELFHFLVYFAQNEVHVTKKGMIMKRHIQKLSQMIELPGPLMAQFFDLEEAVYPPAIEIIYRLARDLDLIQIVGDRMICNKISLTSWLQHDLDELNRLLYTSWIRTHTPTDKNMQHFIISMECIPTYEWCCTDDLEPGIHFDGYPQIRLWLDLMAAFGWMETAKVDSKEWIRWLFELAPNISTDVDQGNHNKLIVQPDYEMIVPPTVSFAIRWELETWADHRQTDQYSTYVLSPQSVTRGVQSGKSPEQCVQFLLQHSLYDIANHVILNVRQWAVQAQEGGHTHDESLIEYDEAPKSSPQHDDHLSMSPLQPSNNAGSKVMYWPTLDEIYPGWMSISSLWLQQMRSYHITTQRQMIEQALAWESLLRLRRGGRDLVVIPVRLMEDQQSFQLEVRQQDTKTLLTPGDWDEMQLLLPGINM